MSLIMMAKSQGPNFVPCGTPAGIGPHSEKQSCDNFTLCWRLVRKLLIQCNVNIKQDTGNIEQSGNVEHSRSNVVQSINNDKDNEPITIEQNTGTIEQSTSNVVQSSITVQQSVDVVNNNSEKCSGINVEKNIDVVNNNSDECSMVNVVADSHPVESLSSFEDLPTWAEVVAMEEVATFCKSAPSMKPFQERKARCLRRSFNFVLLVLAFLCASVRPPMRWSTLLGRPNCPLRVFSVITMASSSVFNSSLSALSINVDGLRDSLKRTALLQWLLAALSVDVVYL